MHRSVLFFLVVFIFSFVAAGQEVPTTLPGGVQFPGQLITKLNSHKTKVGDEVKLEVTANLLGPGGTVVLPKGAKLIGSVTEVKDHNAEDGQSSLAFVINKAEWHGGSMSLHAAPTAVTAPRIRAVREGGDNSGFEGGGGGRRGGGQRGGGSGGGDDSMSLISNAIALELKGVEVRQTSDANVGTAFFSRKDVSLPSGAVVTLRQVKTSQ